VSVVSLRTGLATRLTTIAGLRASATVPDDVQPPMAVVGAPKITYDTTMGRGFDTYEFLVTVIVGRVNERSAQNVLDGYCAPTGATSVKAAIEGNQTLGGASKALRVTEMRGNNALVIGDITYLAAEFVVIVYA
jgi:hypothetical protein